MLDAGRVAASLGLGTPVPQLPASDIQR